MPPFSAAGSRAAPVFLLGPSLRAISGVSTHLNFLFASSLARDFDLRHFQVGGEGLRESGPRRLWRLLSSPLLLAAWLLRERGAIVHLNTSLNRRAFWRDLAYLLVARCCGAKIVYQVHGGALPRQFCIDNRLPAAWLRAVLRLPDALVVLASSELAAYREFIADRPVLVVPNGVDWRAFDDGSRGTPVRSASLRLLYLGRLTREKGLVEALQGLAQANARGVRASLVLAGSGPDAPLLRALVRRLGLMELVEFVGPVFGGAKRAQYRAADVLLLPTYAEGLPYALLEGMAAGLPVIATPVGGIPDVVREGVHGLLVPPRDAPAIARAIARLAADRPTLERMRTACVERIANGYSIAAVSETFARLYRSIGQERRLDVLGES